MSSPKPESRALRRPYDASGRREKAAQTRGAVHRAAFELFGARGYTGTTLADVAAAAGVSVETVSKMGPKSSLLAGARVVAVFDTTDVDSLTQSDVMTMVAAQGDFDGAVDVLVDFYAVSNRRAAAFWQTWRAAAIYDTAVAHAWAKEMSSARSAFDTSIRYARDRGWLREDLGQAELSATLWLLASAETYTRLTVDAGLDDTTYRTWLGRSLREQLGAR